jgi:hypothetical protein
MKGSAYCQEQKGQIPNREKRYSNHSERFLDLLFGWTRRFKDETKRRMR